MKFGFDRDTLTLLDLLPRKCAFHHDLFYFILLYIFISFSAKSIGSLCTAVYIMSGLAAPLFDCQCCCRALGSLTRSLTGCSRA
jgi:hypothetical protein